MKNKLKFQTSLVLYKHDQTSYKNDFMQIGGLEKLKKEWEENVRMLRWIRGHTRKDKIRDDCIQGDIGVMSIEEKMIENLLRWFGHMQKRPSNAPVRRVA